MEIYSIYFYWAYQPINKAKDGFLGHKNIIIIKVSSFIFDLSKSNFGKMSSLLEKIVK